MRRLWMLIKKPIFIWITIAVHTFIASAGLTFFWLERGVNPSVHGILDGLYWAVATATTVGYGDIVTITTAGKVLAMGLMVIGTLFSAVYTALFASALIAPEFKEVEKDLHEVENEFQQIKRDAQMDARTLALLQEYLEKAVEPSR
jgi:voltage-gated potassium channel Kch